MSVNRKKTGKRKAPRTAWKPGQSGNPAGAPKRGESWAELWKKVGNMTPGEAADYCRMIAGQLATIGNNVTLKEAVVLRVYAALMFEPDARLLNSVMDRDEGKVTQAITVEDVTRKQDSELIAELQSILDTAAASTRASDSSGTPAAGAGDGGNDTPKHA